MLDNLWNYIEANSATLITSYIGILFTLYLRRKDRENDAIDAYLSTLGIYIENQMLPLPKYLANMKMQFAKYYHVSIGCFPIKRKALRKVLFLYRSNPMITLQRQIRMEYVLKKVQSRFMTYDSMPIGKAKDILTWKQMINDASFAFAFVMFMLSLQIINTPEKLSLFEILIVILLYSFFALLTSVLVSFSFFAWYQIKRKYCE